MIYGIRLAELLNSLGHEVYTIISDGAFEVADAECLGRERLLEVLKKFSKEVFAEKDFTAPLASSSFLIDAVVIAPCSLKTLSDVANSRQDSLVSRVAGNALRLRKTVVLLIRDTPLSTIDVLNMLKASLAGAVIMPASPGFYSIPRDVRDMIDFLCGKILDVLGIDNDLYRRWGSRKITPRNSLCDRLYG